MGFRAWSNIKSVGFSGNTVPRLVREDLRRVVGKAGSRRHVVRRIKPNYFSRQDPEIWELYLSIYVGLSSIDAKDREHDFSGDGGVIIENDELPEYVFIRCSRCHACCPSPCSCVGASGGRTYHQLAFCSKYTQSFRYDDSGPRI